MDDLVVIILTLIIVVIGAIGQFKKKRQAPANTGQNSNSGDFWDMLAGEQEFVPQQPEFTPSTEPMPPEPVPKSREYTFSPKNEGVRNRAKTPDEIKQPMFMTEEEQKEKTGIKDFSLRKAIIYSEIINRKYM